MMPPWSGQRYLIRKQLFTREVGDAPLYHHTDADGQHWINLDYTRNYPGGELMNEEIVGVLELSEAIVPRIPERVPSPKAAMKKLVDPSELAKASHMRPGDPRISLLTEVSGLKRLERFYNSVEALHDMEFVAAVFRNLELEIEVSQRIWPTSHVKVAWSSSPIIPMVRSMGLRSCTSLVMCVRT